MPKFLIIRFSSIGDIVLTTPVIRCLKLQVPDAEIHFLTKHSFASILQANPYIDKVISIDKSVAEILPELKKVGYDFIVDLHHNLRSKKVITSLKKSSASFPKLNFKKWLLVHFKVNKLPNIHIVDRYFAAVARLGVKNDLQGLDFFIPDSNSFDTLKIPQEFKSNYVALVIGAQHFTKRMPNAKLIELCKHIKQPVILIGGKEDAANAEEINSACQHKIFNACGKFSLFESALLIKNAAVVITHDTGMMHIAAAFHKKIISLWGNTVPEFGMYPYIPSEPENNVSFEVLGLSCRPCSKIGKRSCPKGHFNCMNQQDITAIAKHLYALQVECLPLKS